MALWVCSCCLARLRHHHAAVGCKERVAEELLKGDALHWIALQQTVDQVYARRAQMPSDLVWNLGFMPLNVLQQDNMVAAVEGRATHDQLVQDGSHTPEVSLGAM